MEKEKKRKFNFNIKEFTKKYPVMIFFMGSNFINTIFLRLFTTKKFEIRSILIDFCFVVFLGAMSLLFKNKKRRYRYYGIASFLMVATCVSNSLYYNYYTSFVSISLLATSVFVKDVSDAVMDMVVRVSDLSYLWVFVGLYIVKRRCKEEFVADSKSFFRTFEISLVALAMGCALPPYNSFSRLYKLWNRVMVFNSWGAYVYQVDDIVQSLKPTFNNLFGYDTALKNTKDYYEKNSNSPSINEYSGIFEGKNVIVIHAESLQTFTIGLEFNGKEVTPNLNKLVNSGMYFNNYYAQVGVGTSSDTEFTYASSLLPANNGTVFVNYFNNKFVTIQNLLHDKGYYVFSMHGNGGDFWNRDTMHINMGYDKFYSKSSFVIDEEYGLGLSDESFFRQAVPMIKEISENVTGPYYGTLITLTNHTPWRDAYKYSDYDVSMSVNINGEIIKRDYLENTAMGKYLKSVNYMDKAIGNFIQEMDEAGLLDDTVIVVYGDHDARLARKQFDYMYNYDPITGKVRAEDSDDYIEFNDYDYELNRKVPLIIWTNDMDEGMIIDKPMGMIDAMPTLGNMLGIYNKYALGKDIMSVDKEDAIVVFKDGSYITDKIYYSARNNEAYMISNGIISDDYIKKNCDYADKIIEVSDNIITYDLIKELN